MGLGDHMFWGGGAIDTATRHHICIRICIFAYVIHMGNPLPPVIYLFWCVKGALHYFTAEFNVFARLEILVFRVFQIV